MLVCWWRGHEQAWRHRHSSNIIAPPRHLRTRRPIAHEQQPAAAAAACSASLASAGLVAYSAYMYSSSTLNEQARRPQRALVCSVGLHTAVSQDIISSWRPCHGAHVVPALVNNDDVISFLSHKPYLPSCVSSISYISLYICALCHVINYKRKKICLYQNISFPSSIEDISLSFLCLIYSVHHIFIFNDKNSLHAASI